MACKRLSLLNALDTYYLGLHLVYKELLGSDFNSNPTGMFS